MLPNENQNSLFEFDGLVRKFISRLQLIEPSLQEAEILGTIFFGSRMGGNARPDSDLDFFMVMETPQNQPVWIKTVRGFEFDSSGNPVSMEGRLLTQASALHMCSSGPAVFPLVFSRAQYFTGEALQPLFKCAKNRLKELTEEMKTECEALQVSQHAAAFQHHFMDMSGACLHETKTNRSAVATARFLELFKDTLIDLLKLELARHLQLNAPTDFENADAIALKIVEFEALSTYRFFQFSKHSIHPAYDSLISTISGDWDKSFFSVENFQKLMFHLQKFVLSRIQTEPLPAGEQRFSVLSII